jgi:hypothetical protein
VNKELAVRNNLNHDPLSPILFGTYDEEKIKERRDIKSYHV